MFITSSWIIDVVILFTTFLFLTYKYFTRHYDYFKKRNIQYEKPIPFFGNLLPVISMKTTLGELLRDLYNATDKPYFGIFIMDEPGIVLKSPDLIKQVLVKHFNKFSDRVLLAPKHDEIIKNMLFLQKNPVWKNVRTKVSPVYSSGKIKAMFPIINEIAVNLNRYIGKHPTEIESKELAAKFATDVISKCAFAINANSFEDEDAYLRKIGRSFVEFTFRNAFSQGLYFLKPKWAQFLRLNFIERWATDSLKVVFRDVMRHKQESNVKGIDVVDLLIEIKNNQKLGDGFKFGSDEIVAQALQFFVAGSETTSATISFSLYELSLHPKVQDKLREEIFETIKKHDGITFDGLKEMKYLDMCISETVRKYPPLPFLDRKCNETHRFEGTDLVIEKGTSVYIPLMGLHNDEKYFPENEKYDPERFANKHSHNTNGLYFMPFGEGPRICIGERFGMLTVKLGLVHILSEFIVEPTKETPVPVKFEPKSFALQSTVGIPLKYRKLQLPQN